MERRIAFTIVLTMIIAPLAAEIPANYYAPVNNKSGDEVISALFSIISDHTNVGYDGLYDVYPTADVVPGTKQVWDMYSTCTFIHGNKKCGSYKNVCDCYNREHSIPQSWFNEASPMKSDAFHVYPTDGKVNGQRSNYPYGECENGTRLTSTAKGRLGTSTFTGYSGKVFEPDDEYKGDFARTYFYMVACYRNKNLRQSDNGSVIFTYSNSKTGLTDYAIRLFMKWHREDPVSQKEIDRNNAVYAIQKNRNPFIDYPCLAEYVWGEQKGETVILGNMMSSAESSFLSSDRTGCNCSVTQPTLQSPKQGTNITIGEAGINEQIYASVHVGGALLTKPLLCSVSGTNADMFSVSTNTISASEANDGYVLKVYYRPTAIGQHTATVTLTSEEINPARTITVNGTSSATLVTPETGSTISMIAYDVNVPVTQKVYVKSTNLTGSIYVGIGSGTYKGLYSVSPTSLTADQANQGTYITITYTPTSLGVHKVPLILNSTAKEFQQPSISIDGQCKFDLLPVTNVRNNSVTLNWTDAGVASYIVDVYQTSVEKSEDVTLFHDDCSTLDNFTKTGYADLTSELGAIRLGSSDLGKLTSKTTWNLTGGATLTIRAKYFNSDASTMKVTFAGVTRSFNLTADYQDYTIDIVSGPADASLIIETLASKKRLYLTDITITTGGEKEVRQHVNGYPQTVYGSLFHDVNGLETNQEYFYTVQPEGHDPSEEEAFVTENGWTGYDFVAFPDATWRVEEGHIVVEGLKSGEKVTIYDAIGRINDCGTGIHLIYITNGKESRTINAILK